MFILMQKAELSLPGLPYEQNVVLLMIYVILRNRTVTVTDLIAYC